MGHIYIYGKCAIIIMTNGTIQTSAGPIAQVNPPAILQQEFLKWLSTPEEVFIWIEHNLKGEILKIVDGNETWDKSGEAMCSDEGAEAIVQELRWYVNKFTFHADYNEDEINMIMSDLANNLDIYLTRNWRKFDVKPSVFYSGILSDGIINMIYSAYKMSGMRKFYEDVLQVRHGFPPIPQKKKKILGIFPSP